MWIFWRQTTETRDLGVVAEQCPTCARPTPCHVLAVCEEDRVLFVKVSGHTTETFCLCATCGIPFPCELWRYPDIVPAPEADPLSVEALVARTNPGLVERLQWKEQVGTLGGDNRFTAAYEQLDGMRPGELQAGLLKQLLDWGRLQDEQRDGLAQRVGTFARAWQFARQVAPGFPAHVGCLSGLLAALVVWSAFLWAPVHTRLWGTVTFLAGCAAAAITGRVLLARRVRGWTRKVLVSRAQHANVSLPCFLAVVEDLPATKLCVLDDLWPIKDQIETIRAVLAGDGRL
jgi:hypothetical protein